MIKKIKEKGYFNEKGVYSLTGEKWDLQGYDKDGYDFNGFNSKGIHRRQHNRSGKICNCKNCKMMEEIILIEEKLRKLECNIERIKLCIKNERKVIKENIINFKLEKMNHKEVVHAHIMAKEKLGKYQEIVDLMYLRKIS